MADKGLNITRQEFYLAALLHDVGKIGQRANIPGFNEAECQPICPTYNGIYTHRHVWWTQLFFQTINKAQKRAINWLNVEKLAKAHHKPDNIYSAIIAYADALSAGMDRNYENDEKVKNFRNVSLTSILSRINKNEKYAYFDLKPLSSENLYPSSVPNQANEQKYEQLWNNLIRDFNLLKVNHLDEFEYFDFTLLHILRRYMWAVPADTRSMADISLFEHSKTTAAFAISIFDFCLNSDKCNITSNWINIPTNVFPFAFVGVDVSGIQNFIYDIITNKAAKSLKGRSFYLELLTLALIEKFREIFDAYYAQIIYSAGAKFFALVPNINLDEKLAKFQQQVELKLWKEHREKLAVVIDAIKFNFDPNNKKKILIEGGDKPYDISKLWSFLAVALTEKKSRKYFYVLKEAVAGNIDYQIFTPKKLSKGVTVCSVSGVEFIPKPDEYLDEKNKQIPVTKLVKQQTELGTALKRAIWLIMTKDKLPKKQYNLTAEIQILDYNFYLTDNEGLPYTSLKYKAFRFNNPEEYLSEYEVLPDNGYGYIFYAGNKVPVYKSCTGEIEKTTDNLAIADDGKSPSMLGVLRMDVDNLGAIFASGLEDHERSLGALATISFMLNLFFTKYLSELRNKEPYKNWVNILYAGGDDLFVFGRWKEVLEFAEVVRNQFAQFVLNPKLTISGGLVFVHGKFPIAKAAELAAEAEDMAKQSDKNAIVFFGRRVSWQNFATVKRYKTHLLELIKDYKLSRGFLQRLIQFEQMKQAGNNAYLWTSMYYLARVFEKYKKNKTIANFVENLMKDLFQNPNLYTTLAIAARWTEKELKTIKK